MSLALVVDDEPQIRRVVRNAIAGDFSRVVEAATGAQAIDLAAAERPALIVLDLGLPDMAGVDVCREVRKWSSAPIIVLSARHTDTEKVTLLDAGVDDYVTKPFSTVEFQARVRALLRRTNRGPDASLQVTFGNMTLDLAAHTLTRSGEHMSEHIHLTPTEWDLLRVLATNPGKVLTHQQLFNAVWSGRNYGDAQQYLRVYVANIRRKIEDNPLTPRYLVTEPGVGYRFNPAP